MSANILIVDDEKVIRDSISLYFQSEGYRTESAENGAVALAMLGNKKFDVIISDIIMPEMDGVELLYEVRRQYPMTRVIIITGYVTLNNALACMRYGADTCLFKPIENIDNLRKAVEQSMEYLNKWQKVFKELTGMKPTSEGTNAKS